MNIFIRWAVLAVSVWVSTLILPGINVTGGAWSYLWVALLFGVVNAVIGSTIKLLTLPAVLLSLGLFIWVINAAMLLLVDRWSTAIEVSSFWSALFAALIISIVSMLMKKTVKKVSGTN